MSENPELNYTGHPLFDVGLATICAFANKTVPDQLAYDDLEQIADYMEHNYVIDPMKSFLTVAFPNSGFTQPAYDKQPAKRKQYTQNVLRAYRPEAPTLDEACIFTGSKATGISLDVKGELQAGRAFRQHVPLVTGEDVINFHPYGDAGLYISGCALLAIQALPLGCAKVSGRLLAVHSDSPDITFEFARRFLEMNRRAIQIAQQNNEKKLPEQPQRAKTLLIGILTDIEAQQTEDALPSSITAYHLSNSGQGADLDIYHVPLEIGHFLRLALTPKYRDSWNALCKRGWQIIKAKKSKKQIVDTESITLAPKYNVLYEDLFSLPDEWHRFVHRYFLRFPKRFKADAQDPSLTYSLRSEYDLVSWDLTELFLREVVHMERSRIGKIRSLGENFAQYIDGENDRRFFQSFITAKSYQNLRAAILRISLNRLKKGEKPIVDFDTFVGVFEEGEETPFPDWRTARDLVLIRMIDALYQAGWLKAHAEEIPEPEDIELVAGS